jgi:glycine dehydrogenase
MTIQNWLQPTDDFLGRHLGSTAADLQEMLAILGHQSLDALADAAIPSDIRLRQPLGLPLGVGEQAVLGQLKAMGAQNRIARSLIGMGYYDCVTPSVILRNILENPAWYTQYTPYQAEIAQGRLEALVNFQTIVGDLTGLPLANASLLDEATAAAEAMAMCYAILRLA